VRRCISVCHTSGAPNIMAFVREGVWHIWIGFDHVLFLLSLLLPAVWRRGGGRCGGHDGSPVASSQGRDRETRGCRRRPAPQDATGSFRRRDPIASRSSSPFRTVTVGPVRPGCAGGQVGRIGSRPTRFAGWLSW